MPFFSNESYVSPNILVKIDFLYLFIFSLVILWFKFNFDILYLIQFLLITRFPYYFLLQKKKYKFLKVSKIKRASI